MSRYNSLQDIRNRKAQVAKELASTRSDVQLSFYKITHPETRLPKFITASGLKKTYKIASKAIYFYKLASSVTKFFKKNR